MAAYKRSDPTKLRKEREAIARDLKSREPSLLDQFVTGVREKIARRRARAQGYGPAPRIEGAAQIGFKKPRSEA